MNAADNIFITLNKADLYTAIKGKKVFAIIDRNVADYVPKDIVSPEKCYYLTSSESRKTIEAVEDISEFLIEQGADRDCFLLGIGGGITTDIVGFTAAVYKRGVHFGLLPTTLLAQVDAAIGGKNGINVQHYKNMLGTFNTPDFVVINPKYTFTLPDGIWHCGLAEMVKTFLIADRVRYDFVVAQYPDFRENERVLTRLIFESVRIKTDIVHRDPHEEGERRKLNLGHTFGHAIEKCDRTVMHGEAVSIGIIIAAKISQRLGLLSPQDLTRLIKDFQKMHLPVVSPIPARALFDAVSKDKKVFDNKIKFILLTSIGSVRIEELELKQLRHLVDDL